MDYAFIEITNHTTRLKFVDRLKIHSQEIATIGEKEELMAQYCEPGKGKCYTILLRRTCRKKKLEKSTSKTLQHNNSIKE